VRFRSGSAAAIGSRTRGHMCALSAGRAARMAPTARPGCVAQLSSTVPGLQLDCLSTVMRSRKTAES